MVANERAKPTFGLALLNVSPPPKLWCSIFPVGRELFGGALLHQKSVKRKKENRCQSRSISSCAKNRLSIVTSTLNCWVCYCDLDPRARGVAVRRPLCATQNANCYRIHLSRCVKPTAKRWSALISSDHEVHSALRQTTFELLITWKDILLKPTTWKRTEHQSYVTRTGPRS